MKLIKFSFTLLVLSLLLTSCIYHCDGFPQELSGWTPYKLGDVIKFQSDSDQIVFEIDSVFITKPYAYEFNLESNCHAVYDFSSNTNKFPKLSGHCGIANGSFVSVFYFLTFHESKQNLINFDFYLNNNTKFVVNEYKLDTIEYMLKNTIIKDVISIERLPPYNNPDVNKIFAHNGKGLVGFIKNGKEYKLVE